MNEKLLEYLPDPNTVKGGLAGVVETIQREAPLVCKEIVNWAIVCRMSIAIVAMVCFVLLFMLIKKYIYPWAKREGDDAGETLFFGIILPCIPMVFCFLVAVISSIQCLKPLIVPHLFLLEYLANLLK